MRLIASLLLSLISPAVCGQRAVEKAIRTAAERQLQAYPSSTLRDLYKSFFQDRFGPGHLISDTASAGAFLREELASRSRFKGPLYEPAGCARHFVRVNLAVVKDGLVPFQTYFSAFLRSAEGFRPVPLEEWRREWSLISGVISKLDRPVENYAKDSLELVGLLNSGECDVHHSRAFSESYDPHYRIIRRDIFEDELLPLINHEKPQKQEK